MRRFQFTLLGMLGLTACVAMGCGALVQATPIWCSLVVLAVVMALLTAIVGIIYRHGADRAFWVGFTVFGWGYLAVAYGPVGPIRDVAAGDMGFPGSESLLDWLYEKIHRKPAFPGGGRGSGMFSLAAEPTKGQPDDIDPFGPTAFPQLRNNANDPFAAGPVAQLGQGVQNLAVPPPSPADFRVIGNCLLALIFALIGGFTSRGFYVTSENRRGPPPAN